MEYACCANERLSGFAGWAVIAFSIFAGKVTVGLLRWRYNRLKKPFTPVAMRLRTSGGWFA